MIQESKLISIILPVYNGEEYLAEAIVSCLTQTHKKLELIIVNDCSIDNSLQIAEAFKAKDSRVTIITNKVNRRLPASLNIGHKAAQGEYITWTSDDNIFKGNAIQVLLDKILQSATDVVYSNFHVIKENGTIRKGVKLENGTSLLYGNTIGASFLYKRSVFTRNDGYNENLHSVEDYDFWLRATLHSKFFHIKESLYDFRSHGLSLSSQLRIKNTPENKLYTQNIKCCYKNYLRLLDCDSKQNENYAEILKRIHLYEEFDVLSLLQNYSSFKNFLIEIAGESEFLKIDELLKNLDIRIRANIQQHQNNQTLDVLICLIRRNFKILYNYDRRNSLNIIQKCLK